MQTETAVRFSLVTHGRDSPEGLRNALSDELIIQIALVWSCLECAFKSESVVRVQTETAVRFSLVTHGRDSPEGLRDVRGFATKFYTSEGNWDLVGNNIPVRPFTAQKMSFPQWHIIAKQAPQA